MGIKTSIDHRSGKFSESKTSNQNSPLLDGANQALPFEALIMAGGKGERMRPLTLDTPKALLKVGDKPISEYILQRLVKSGVKEVTFFVNYLGEKIANHFGDGKKWNANIGYVFEKDPLGTIGGLKLKQNFKFEDLLIINGDLLTTIHFDKFFRFYLEEEADLAVATIPYRVNLPYGIFEISENHQVSSVREKPILSYYLNTGIYFIRRELVDLIPEGKPFDAVDLIQIALDKGKKVISYPMHEYWVDIGQMEDYQQAQEDIAFLDL